jgi:hypothetical protein
MDRAVTYYMEADTVPACRSGTGPAPARSLRSVCVRFGVPFSTLRRHVDARRAGKPRPVVGRGTVLSLADELLVAEWLEMRTEYNSSVMRMELRQRVALLADARGGPQFSIGKPAGSRWMRGFLRRHPHLVATTTRTTSARLPTKEEWTSFFDAVRVYLHGFRSLHPLFPLFPSSPFSLHGFCVRGCGWIARHFGE